MPSTPVTYAEPYMSANGAPPPLAPRIYANTTPPIPKVMSHSPGLPLPKPPCQCPLPDCSRALSAIPPPTHTHKLLPIRVPSHSQSLTPVLSLPLSLSPEAPGLTLRLQQSEDVTLTHWALDVAHDHAALVIQELHAHLCTNNNTTSSTSSSGAVQ